MNYNEIKDDLSLIIKQAEENGFILFQFCQKYNINMTGMYDGIIWQLWSMNLIDLLLLNKEFNKAFWGEEPYKKTEYVESLYKNGLISRNDYVEFKYDNWQYHLQKVVLEDNKIEYFKRGLK